VATSRLRVAPFRACCPGCGALHARTAGFDSDRGSHCHIVQTPAEDAESRLRFFQTRVPSLFFRHFQFPRGRCLEKTPRCFWHGRCSVWRVAVGTAGRVGQRVKQIAFVLKEKLEMKNGLSMATATAMTACRHGSPTVLLCHPLPYRYSHRGFGARHHPAIHRAMSSQQILDATRGVISPSENLFGGHLTRAPEKTKIRVAVFPRLLSEGSATPAGWCECRYTEQYAFGGARPATCDTPCRMSQAFTPMAKANPKATRKP
jgi:hypothetical protein